MFGEGTMVTSRALGAPGLSAGRPGIDALDKSAGGNEAKGVNETRALANCFDPAAGGIALLWWRELTFAARWRGW